MKEELRIGNYVYHQPPSTRGFILTQMKPSMFLSSGDLKPVPLDPKWLGRFGFHDPIYVAGMYYTEKQGLELRWSSDHPYVFGITNRSIDVTTVHHLQNLFFCLRGKELNTD